MHKSISSFFWVASGGAIGASCRYLASLLTQSISVTIPYGTFFSNLAGCFLLGAFVGVAAGGRTVPTDVRLLFATGFCGAFTTMSTFIYEIIQYARNREILIGSLYFALSLIGSLVCFILGMALMRLIYRS